MSAVLHVSTHESGKLRGFKSINTNSLTIDFCKKMSSVRDSICSVCYSNRMLQGLRNNCVSSFESNNKVLSTKLLTSREITRFNESYVRVHSFGEFINRIHVKNIYKIAKMNPHTRFVIWTKRVNLVKGLKKPKNIVLIYSTLKINESVPKIPEGFNKVFSVYTKEYAKENKIKINCGAEKGGCLACMRCYSTNTRYINEIIK